MASESDLFEVNRWHSPEYIKSWAADRVREAERRPLRNKLVSFLPFERTSAIRVLDLGTGTGALSLEVLLAYPKAELVCQDFSEAMLSRARQELAEFPTQVSYIKGDLRGPEWREAVKGKFDAVVSSFVMHTVSRSIRDTYHRIFSLVKLGGCFLTCDMVGAPGPILSRVYSRSRLIAYQAALKAETGVEKSLEEIEMEFKERRRRRNTALPGLVHRGHPGVPALTTHLEWLEQAGFDEVDCLWKDMRRAIIGGFRHPLDMPSRN
jgi:tRNA (cmo5U34)-methyltransferase